jgi:hypothetical protein
MNEPDTRVNVNAVVFLTIALGGRPIYAFAWGLWLGVVIIVTEGADFFRSERHFPSTARAFTGGVALTFIIGLRLVLFLKNKDQRRLLFSIDPRCAAQKFSLFSRITVMLVPVLGLLAIAAIWIWR